MEIDQNINLTSFLTIRRLKIASLQDGMTARQQLFELDVFMQLFW